jgi:hypothetical protein
MSGALKEWDGRLAHPIFPTYRGMFSDPAGSVYQVTQAWAPPITTANFAINGPPGECPLCPWTIGPVSPNVARKRNFS